MISYTLASLPNHSLCAGLAKNWSTHGPHPCRFPAGRFSYLPALKLFYKISHGTIIPWASPSNGTDSVKFACLLADQGMGGHIHLHFDPSRVLAACTHLSTSLSNEAMN